MITRYRIHNTWLQDTGYKIKYTATASQDTVLIAFKNDRFLKRISRFELCENEKT